jgi:DNA polymerase-3 subunit delta'
MSMAEVQGQPAVAERLSAILAAHKLSHAYLFAGPTGAGKFTMARQFAKAILCDGNGQDACEQCVECRKVNHGTHDHLFEVEPDGTQIKIEQVRELQRQLANKLGHKPKIYIIKDAERMNVYAANSLLKFLEEPDTHVVAILLTSHETAILPTILSRVQKISFAAQTNREYFAHLQQKVAEEPAFAEIRSLVIQLGKELLSKQASPLVTIHQQLPKQDVIAFSQMVLEYMTLWYKDCIAVFHGRHDGLTYTDQLSWMQATVLLKPLHFWIDCLEHVLDCQKKLRSYVNPALAWDQLIVRNQG